MLLGMLGSISNPSAFHMANYMLLFLGLEIQKMSYLDKLRQLHNKQQFILKSFRIF